MEIKKAAGLDAGQADEKDMEEINRLSRKKLKPEEVYTFSIRLCDNEVDRDGERFSPEALEELSRRFVGKSGVFDHQWSAGGQTARIYRAQVEEERDSLTRAGDSYRYVKAWAYMVRTEGNRDLIAEIDGGIKKEVSVGCAVERAVCSICGENIRDREKCRHEKGKTYGGKLCWAQLEGVTDAYEWSFVAVPAQPRAGVLKRASQQRDGLRKAIAASGREECLLDLEELEREARLGRSYLRQLRREVVRLSGLAQADAEPGRMADIVEKLGEDELLELKKHYEERARERFPLRVQLTYSDGPALKEPGDRAFLI